MTIILTKKQLATGVIYPSKIAKSFVRKDLSIIRQCDFIIAYLPKGVRTFGTTHEIIENHNNKKPTLLVTDGNIINLPLWFYGFVPTKYMFNNWEEMYNYLHFVDDGVFRGHDYRWDLVYGEI